MFEHRFAEQSFAGPMSASANAFPAGVISHVAFVRLREPEHLRRLENRQQIVNFEQEVFSDVVDVFLAAAVVEQLEQARNPAGTGMWEQLRAGSFGVPRPRGRRQLPAPAAS